MIWVPLWAQNAPIISLVANAEGEVPIIAPNTWVEIKGSNLSKPNDTRPWQGSDFVNGQMPANLDGVSVTVNGKSAFVYYISPTQINILTPPDSMPASVTVVVTTNAGVSAGFQVKAAPMSPSFFVFGAGPYVIATHSSDFSIVGPASLYPNLSTPAKPGETILVYANGFGPTSAPIVNGSSVQSGELSPYPVITVGGIAANMTFAGLVAPGEFQFNVVLPLNLPSGDLPIVATYNGSQASPDLLITIQGSSPAPTTVTFYVAPNGNDLWSGPLAAPNAANTDGPFATFDRARAAVQSISKTGIDAGRPSNSAAGPTIFPSTEMLTAADSGTATTPIVYQNYPGESPVFSGGVRVKNWTNAGGNTWKTTLPASTQYFETLFYNGVRRLRPRLGECGFPAGNVLPDREHGLFEWRALRRRPRRRRVRLLGIYSGPAAGNVSTGSSTTRRTRSRTPGRIWRRPRATPAASPPGNPAIAGDIEVLVFEQFSTSKLRISCIDTTNHIVYLTGPTGISQNNAERGGLHRRQPVSGGERSGPADAAGAMVSGPFDHSVDATYLANSGENPNTGHRDHSATTAGAGGFESAIRDVSGIDVRARQLHPARAGTRIVGTGSRTSAPRFRFRIRSTSRSIRAS